ncbi:MAG: YncE family protein [Chitinophagales bacterium]
MQASKKMTGFALLLILLCSGFYGCKGQGSFGINLLQLRKTIELPAVKGRIDHLDINLKDQILYVAALGNNTLEAVDLRTGKVIHSIKGLDEPQGVGYIPQTGEILVANGGSGDCYFYDARSFGKTAAIHLDSDADDVRYDSAARKIYVGYGKGGIAIIDPETHKQTGDIKLPAHPESFQIDRQLNLLFVNLPDAHMVAVVDLTRIMVISRWERNEPTANFPMALDSTHHHVFVGYRHPAKLIVFDGKSGKEIGTTAMAGDADDLYYDDKTSSVFVSGGAGSINIFQDQNGTTCKQIAGIPTRSGARTSLLVPHLRLLVLAERAVSGKPADLLIYKISQ